MRESKGREGGGVSEARQRGWMYTRGRSQDLRDVTAKIRAIELFNPDGLSRSAPLSRFRPLCEPPALPLPACLPASSPSILRRSPFTPSPSNSPSGLLPLSLVPLRSLFFFFRRSVLFLSRLSRPCSGPALSLSSSAITPACVSSTLALLSRRPCSRAVPLYLPPPVVPSSLKAVESNR